MMVAFYAIGAALLLANAWMTARVWKSAAYTRDQRIAQTALVWLLPVAGAIVIYAALRHEDDVRRLTPNPEGGEHRALWDNHYLDPRG